jgi:hypothetical protein
MAIRGLRRWESRHGGKWLLNTRVMEKISSYSRTPKLEEQISKVGRKCQKITEVTVFSILL